MMKTPQCDKLAAVGDHAQAIHEFLEWLGHSKYVICVVEESTDRFYPSNDHDEELVNAFFDIDSAALEKERKALLQSLRSHSS